MAKCELHLHAAILAAAIGRIIASSETGRKRRCGKYGPTERQPRGHATRIRRGQFHFINWPPRASSSWLALRVLHFYDRTRFSVHTEDQGANLFADTLPSSYLSDSRDPCPIQMNPARCLFTTVLGVTKDERFSPSGPACPQRNPDQLVQGSQSAVRSLRVQSQQLPTESQVFEDEVLGGRKALTIHPRRYWSDAIIARVASEKSESSFVPSHSFCRCTTFWRGTSNRFT